MDITLINEVLPLCTKLDKYETVPTRFSKGNLVIEHVFHQGQETLIPVLGGKAPQQHMLLGRYKLPAGIAMIFVALVERDWEKKPDVMPDFNRTDDFVIRELMFKSHEFRFNTNDIVWHLVLVNGHREVWAKKLPRNPKALVLATLYAPRPEVFKVRDVLLSSQYTNRLRESRVKSELSSGQLRQEIEALLGKGFRYEDLEGDTFEERMLDFLERVAEARLKSNPLAAIFGDLFDISGSMPGSKESDLSGIFDKRTRNGMDESPFSMREQKRTDFLRNSRRNGERVPQTESEPISAFARAFAQALEDAEDPFSQDHYDDPSLSDSFMRSRRPMGL